MQRNLLKSLYLFQKLQNNKKTKDYNHMTLLLHVLAYHGHLRMGGKSSYGYFIIDVQTELNIHGE